MHAGKLDKRVSFESPISLADAHGGMEEGFQAEFEIWARIRFLRGTEAVMESRLEGKQPVIFTVRKSPESDRITNNWKAVFNGTIFNLRETPQPSDDRLYLELLAEGGVAT